MAHFLKNKRSMTVLKRLKCLNGDDIALAYGERLTHSAVICGNKGAVNAVVDCFYQLLTF